MADYGKPPSYMACGLALWDEIKQVDIKLSCKSIGQKSCIESKLYLCLDRILQTKATFYLSICQTPFM